MKSKTMTTAAILSLAASLAGSAAYAQGANRVREAIWADGELFDTVVTPTSFVAPPEHSTDIIYSFMMSGLEGQRSVAASAPGQRDYNGGRWDVRMVIFTDAGLSEHDPDGDGVVNFELKSEDEVLQEDMDGYLIINDANFYFECPLLPRRGR